jgi:hypothetical protein
LASSRQYDYKKPSSFNFVSLLFVLAVAAGIYWGVKFGPVYWNRYKVDEILRDEAARATNMSVLNSDAQDELEKQVLKEARQRLEERGVQASVYFDAAHKSLHADYDVVVKHPVGKPTLVRMRRKAKVP